MAASRPGRALITRSRGVDESGPRRRRLVGWWPSTWEKTVEEERFGITERLLESIRDGIDAARYFARHEAVAGMTSDEKVVIELANAVEEAAADLDDAMMALLEHQGRFAEGYDEKVN
jgi:hypothetical protein